MTADVAALLALACSAADAAGTVVSFHQHHRGNAGRLTVATKTSDTDPVSEADRASERALVAAITDVRPEDGILGEEGAERASATGLRWVVDPLDGTVNYLYGHVGWSVSVAVEELQPSGEWRALVGVVLEPSTGVRFQAVRDQGAHMHVPGEGPCPLQVNDPVEPAMALVATGFSYDRAHRRRQARLAAKVLGEVRDLRRVGSAALDLCRVAAGQVDAYYEDSTRRWDWAAGRLIAEEAGAVVTALDTMPGHSGVVAAGPHLHAGLVALVTPSASPPTEGGRPPSGA